MDSINRHRARYATLAFALAVIGFTTACENKSELLGPGPLASLSISPNPQSLGAGTTQQFVATGRDASGNVVTLGSVTWSVVAGGGSVNTDGNFTAGGTAGTFTNTVQATTGGMTATATVLVTAGVLATITVTPNPATLAPNGLQTFTAVGRDAGGNQIAITPVWAVVAQGGTINPATGAFVAGAATGTFPNTIRATSGLISGLATVNVEAPPATIVTITVTPNPASMVVSTGQQFTAVARDSHGIVIAFNPTWSVVNGGGSIAASGFFTAGNTPGSFANTVVATSGSVSGTATVIVTSSVRVLTTITVLPDPATVQAGMDVSFTAVGVDQNGLAMNITPVWSVASGGGTINQNTGRFTAGNVAGTFNNTVRATDGAVQGNATVIVVANTPAPPNFNLGNNGIMAGTAFTCVIGGIINADISISPGVTVTGFPPCVITGAQHLNDGQAIQAQINLTNAYNALAGMACPAANAIVANLGGTTKEAGVYCSASSIGVTGTLTLDGGGDPNAVFVFQAGSSLTTAGSIVLIGGAQAKNVYWLVGSSATIGTASQWQGNIIALTSISLLDNATLLGRALARNGAVSLTTGNIITLP